jgi:hypothetical protein
MLLYVSGKQINNNAYLQASELLPPHAICVVSLLPTEDNTSVFSFFASLVSWTVKS